MQSAMHDLSILKFVTVYISACASTYDFFTDNHRNIPIWVDFVIKTAYLLHSSESFNLGHFPII